MSEQHAEQPGNMRSDGAPATAGSVVAEAIVRLRRLWPRIDTPEVLAEYRRILTELKDPDIINRTVTAVIDSWTQGGLAPPPGMFATRGAELTARRDWRRHTSSDRGLRFLEAAPDPRDPPGTIRWIIVQPDGQRIPAGARAADDMVR